MKAGENVAKVRIPKGELHAHPPAEKKKLPAQVAKKPLDPFGNFFDSFHNKLETNPLLNERQKQRIHLINQVREDGHYIFQQPFDGISGPRINIDSDEYKLLSSYDYLGLIGHKEIEKAAVKAIRNFGTSSGGVRLLSGTNKLHLKLEKELADFIGTESAITYSSGYHANLAILSSLMESKALALIDSKIHQSTLDACKLAGLQHRRFEHNNPASLEDLLQRHHKSGKRILVITEGMFSMDGDICKLEELVSLKKKYGAFLMVDEAHSLGVLGESGRGVASHFKIPATEIDIFTGSLSKAVPASGGYVAGSKELTIFLQHTSSPYIFSAALSPASTASARKALMILQNEPDRHIRLWENAGFLRTELQKAGFDTGMSTTPIIPVILGSDESTLDFSRKLYDRGVLATPVLFPAVPKGQSRLRLCATAAHDRKFLQEVIAIFKAAR